nr:MULTISPECIES: DUF2993 domain-containing protein [Microbacterium]
MATPGRPATKPKRAVWPWLVAAAAVVVLVVVAWIAGEQIARNLLVNTVREQVITQLSLPADQQVDVDVPGPVLPQLIGGEIDEITIASDDVVFGELSGDVSVHATGVPVRGDGPMDAASATITLDEAQLTALLGTIEDFPADTVVIDAPAIEISMELQLFALTVPVGITLVPSAAGGDLVLTPSTLRVAGTEITAEALSRQFGAIAGTVIRDWQVCIADQLPAGVMLNGVEVNRDDIVAEFEIDGEIITDETLQQPGSCA